MSTQLLTFQKFNDPELAATICEQLQANNITCEVTKETASFDPSYANNDFQSNIHLRLPQADFEKAHKILETFYQQQLDNVDKDYYLFSFTNDELLDIVKHPDEWGHFDLALAKKLLAEHGQQIPENVLEKRIVQLSKGDSVDIGWIVFAYIVAISGCIAGTFTSFVSGFYGSIGAGLFGIILAFVKKTLPNGEQTWLFEKDSRTHGKRILIIASISLAVWIYKLLTI